MKLCVRNVVVVSSLSLSAIACSSGGPGELSGPGQTSRSDASSATPAPSATATSASGSGAAASSLGPSCTAYLECCKEVTAAQPQLAGSCDKTQASLEEAQSRGASTKTYESACSSAMTSFKSAGYCK